MKKNTISNSKKKLVLGRSLKKQNIQNSSKGIFGIHIQTMNANGAGSHSPFTLLYQNINQEEKKNIVLSQKNSIIQKLGPIKRRMKSKSLQFKIEQKNNKKTFYQSSQFEQFVKKQYLALADFFQQKQMYFNRSEIQQNKTSKFKEFCNKIWDIIQIHIRKRSQMQNQKMSELNQFSEQSNKRVMFQITSQVDVKFISYKQMSIYRQIVNQKCLIQAQNKIKDTQQQIKQKMEIHVLKQKQYQKSKQNYQQICLKISNAQQKLNQLNKKQLTIMNKIQLQNKTIELHDIKINQNCQFIQSLNQQIQEIHNFLYSQPNQILQKEAKGYKEREQQLFDLAFILEQSTPQKVKYWLEEIILLPQQNLLLAMKNFPIINSNQQKQFLINGKELQNFKKAVLANYQIIMGKVVCLLESKCNKIKEFVGTTRRFASYTIGKRQYLTQIDKKITAAAIFADKNLMALKKLIQLQNIVQHHQIDDIIAQLSKNVLKLKQIYCQAQIFY